jgi:pilus assembly protein CpaB
LFKSNELRFEAASTGFASMKTARLVVLGVALAAGGGAMYLVGGQRTQPTAVVQAIPAAPPALPTDEVLTAAREIPMGTLVADQDLAWTVWPRSAVGAGMLRKSETPNIVADLSGSVSRGSFFQGEPIRREKLVKGPNAGFMSAILPAGMRAVAINIDTQGATTAGGFVLPNDHVDVVRTRKDDDVAKDGGGDAYMTETILSNVLVLAIGQNVQEKNGERVVVGSNATLEVEPRQAEALILAQRTGQLSLTLRSMLDASHADDPSVADSQGKGVTVVRFGVPSSVSKK